MSSDNLIEIASFSYPHEAHIAKASLEAAEIPVFLRNEHLINMQWLYSNAVGGVRLFVPKQYSSTAKELLDTDFSDSLDKIIEIEETVCPNCGSSKIEPYTIGKKPAFIVFLLLGFPLFFYKRGIKCLDCNKFNELDSINQPLEKQ